MSKKTKMSRGKKSQTCIKKSKRIKKNFKSQSNNGKIKKITKRINETKKKENILKSQIQKEQTEKLEEDTITGQDMMGMMNKDAMQTLLNSIPNENNPQDDQDKIVRKLLPIRTFGHEWVDRQIEMKVEPSPLVEKTEEKQKKDELDISKIHSVVQLASERRRILEEKKVTIANYALKIVKDTNNIRSLFALMGMMKEENPLIAISVKKYTTLSLLQVFQDILPGYIIVDSKKNKMKKDTLKTAKEESTILQEYSNYLTLMEGFLDELKKQPESKALHDLAQTVLHCFGELLVQRPSFNYADNIINLVVPYLNHKSDTLRQAVFSPVSLTLQKDQKGKLSLTIMKKIYTMARKTKFSLKPEVLALFFSFQLRNLKNSDDRNRTQRTRDIELKRKERNIKKLAEKFAKKPSKRQKKEMRKMNKLKDQMGKIKEESITDHNSTEHTQILELILGIYFHILKRKPKSNLMGLVMEGLAKFAHLINIEFFSDLLKIFFLYLEDGTFNLGASLNCLSCIFTILVCQDGMLNLDPLKFYNHFYCSLLQVTKDPLNKNLPLALKVAETMLISRKRHVNAERVLAFTKRLATLAPALVHHGAAAACLATLRSLMVTFPTNEALLDADPDGSLGMFSPEIAEPDHAHAVSTAMWELHFLQRHYHSDVKHLSTNILQGCPVKGNYEDLYKFSKRSPQAIYANYEPSQLSFLPPIKEPEDHLRSFKGKTKKAAEMNNLDLLTKCNDVLEELPNNILVQEVDYFSGTFQ